MKKLRTLSVLSAFATLIGLMSCNQGEVYATPIDFNDRFLTGSGKVRPNTVAHVTLFDTAISANLYYRQGDYRTGDMDIISDTLSDDLMLAHAMSDRHYSYDYYPTGNEALGEKITNIKTINESYGSETPVKVDPYLYDLLKYAYDFTLNSHGLYNIFIGTISDVYEDKLAEMKELDYVPDSLNYALSLANHARFDAFDGGNESLLRQAVSQMPTSQEELSSLLSFDDDEKTVTFHTFYKEGVKVDKLEITLGGVAKGYATEYVCNHLKSLFPNISLLINSGASSVKALGTKPNQAPWSITYTNPVYNEYYGSSSANPYNSNDVYFSFPGTFNLSSSGYYNQYFYEYDRGQVALRSHIIHPKTGYSVSYFDQVSVFLDNTGLADMYTTALMNCASVEEAKTLFTDLNTVYGEKDAQMILCYKSLKGHPETQYTYRMEDLSPLSDKSLPIVTLYDGTDYSGDYTDLETYRIKESQTSRQDNFQINYVITPDLYKNTHLMTAEQSIPHPENNLAVLSAL